MSLWSSSPISFPLDLEFALVKNLTGSSTIRICKDPCRSSKTCQRSLRIKIFKRSFKDPARSCKIIYKYPQGIEKDLARILQISWQSPGSSRIKRGSLQDLRRILLKILQRSLQGSFRVLKDLMRIFARS